MSNRTPREFTTEFKERAVLRLEGGERYSALAAELGVRRKLLYEWAKGYDWPWSSARVHLGAVASDGVTDPAPVIERYPDFAALLAAGEDEELSMRLRKAETIGRPLGDAGFLAGLEAATGRTLKPARRGPRPKLNALSP